jgi:glutathione S-transferase
MQTVEILGVPASPYTRKILALLRYRRIPYRVLWGSHIAPPAGYPAPKVKLLPTVYLQTDAGREAMVDSTPIIDRLETLQAERSVRPTDAVLHFLDLLIEDFADEWLTKAMFHYRWHFAPDAKNAGPLIAFGQNPQFDSLSAMAMSESFSKRQISRLPLVGSNAVTAPVIEASFQRLIGILDSVIERHGFLFGARPAAADFAIFGQLTQLGIIDPTSAQLLVNASPRLRAWLDRTEDLSGHTDSPWQEPMTIAAHLEELLKEIGRTYIPFLKANTQAFAKGQVDFETTIDGHLWTQPVFPYQVKCHEALQAARQAMASEARASLDKILASTGCDALFWKASA